MSGARPPATEMPAPAESRALSWRAPSGPRPGVRQARRLAVTGLALLLLGLLAMRLIAPFQQPRTSIVVFTETGASSEQGEDWSRLLIPPGAPLQAEEITGLEPMLLGPGPIIIGNAAAAAGRPKLLESLDALTAEQLDVLILMVSGTGVVEAGRPYLCWKREDGQAPGLGLDIIELLRVLRAHPAATRLVIVDSGSRRCDPRNGAVVNEFPRLLAREVAQLGDPGLWVLHSHSVLEHSQVSAALGRSVFGEFTTRGLAGAADANRDGAVDLDELTRYVATGVSAWVRQTSAGSASQTPVLLHSGGARVRSGELPVLLAAQQSPSRSRDDHLIEMGDIGERAVRTQRVLEQIPGAGGIAGKTSTALTPPAAVVQANDTVARGTAAKDAVAAAAAPASDSSKPDAMSKGTARPASGDAIVASTGDASQSSPAAGTRRDARGTAGMGAAATAGLELPIDAPPPDAAALAALVAEAWELRDALEAAPRSPLVWAPHHWRQLQRQILHDERLVRYGAAIDPRAFGTELRRRNAVLRWLLAPQTAPVPRIPEALAPLVAARPDSPVLPAPESFGEAEMQQRTGRLMPVELREAVLSFDQHLLADRPAGLRTWLEKRDPAFDRYVEIGFARRLLAARITQWPVLRLSLRCRRRAEQVAALGLEQRAWIAPAVETADRLRLAGERLLLDEIGGDREARAASLFDRALAAYDAAALDAGDAQAAADAAKVLLQRLPWYLDWHARARSARIPYRPDSHTLEEMIATLGELMPLLDRPDPERISSLRALHAKLTLLRETVETPFNAQHLASLTTSPVAAGDAWRIEQLLSTPLPRADVRRTLLGAVASVETELLARIRVPSLQHRVPDPADITHADWNFLRRQIQLEHDMAWLAASGTDAATTRVAALQSLARSVAALEEAAAGEGSAGEFGSHEQRMWSVLHAASLALRQFWEASPQRAVEKLASAAAARQRDDTAAQLADLRAALRLLALAEWSEAPPPSLERLPHMLQTSLASQFLAGQGRRVQIALDDAPLTEIPPLLARHERIREELIARPGSPSLPPRPSAPVRIEAPPHVSLVVDPQRRLELQLTSRTGTDTPVWIILDYDPELIEVSGLPEYPTWFQQTLATELAGLIDLHRIEQLKDSEHVASLAGHHPNRLRRIERAAQYPYRPDLAALPPTLVLRGAEPARIPLTVRRRAESASPARLIVKAVAAESYVRHELAVELPSAAVFDLRVTGGAETWSQDGGLVLHPFSNQGTSYRFSIINAQATDQTVEIELISPSHDAAVPLPEASVTAADAERLLSGFGRLTVLGQYPKIMLPPEKAVPIPFVPPPPPGAPPPPAAEVPPPSPLPNGLLFVITDTTTGRMTLRRVTVEPQRPRRYVRPRVGYNPDREQIEITVAPVHPDLLPPGGSHVRCEVAEPLPERAAQREGRVTREHDARLFLAVTPEPGRLVTLRLEVDGYPRAFVYRVPCHARSTDLPEETGLLAARVIAPDEDAAWAAPVAGIPAVVEIDAPPGAFGNGADFVEIGLDRDRDRDLAGDAPLRFAFDRHVQIGLNPPGPEGRLTVVAEVSDFHVMLPAPGLTNARAAVLARVVTGPHSAWSRGREVILDAAPPRILSVGVGGDRAITAGADLNVVALCSDDGLSGVERVEVAVDVARTGEFGEGNKPLPTVIDSEGQWLAKLPTADLSSGRWALLTRAVDRVGNVSPTTRTPFQVVSMEEAAAAAAAATNVVTGVVLYGKDPVPGASVEIEIAGGKKVEPVVTDERGEFRFPKVPVGKATVTASRIVRNNRRKGTAKVEVQAPPATVPSLRIEVR